MDIPAAPDSLSQPSRASAPSGLASLLLRVVAGSGLLLIASTWKLWTPQDVFPQIPLFRFAVGIPAYADWIALGAILTGALTLIAWPRSWWKVIGCVLFCSGLIASIVLDQHRLQPWAYQFLLMTPILTAANQRLGIQLSRILVASVYIYSGWSKLDYSFLASGGVGERFVATSFQVFGVTIDSPQFLAIGSWTMVIGEMIVGLLLLSCCWKLHTRRAAYRWLAISFGILLHVMLLLILGPLGMNHSASVLLWNASFIAILIVCFKPIATNGEPTNLPQKNKAGAALAWSITVIACGLPLLEPLGMCDSWLAWSLYSSRNERALVTIREPGEEDPVFRERIDVWSLKSLGVPIYPENRFRVGVALAIARQRPGREVDIRLDGPANRLTGHRTEELVQGREEIERAADRFWFNAHPRSGD